MTVVGAPTANAPKPILHLFVDTNILIQLFRYTDDSLSEVEKFTELVRAKKISMYVTDQLVWEYLRNSENQINSSIDELDKVKLNVPIPRFVEHYEEVQKFVASLNECEKHRRDMLKKIREDVKEKRIRADKIVVELLRLGQRTPTTDKIVEKARLRREVGNPPGKPNSLGDQINWECLLEHVPDLADIHIISKDGDFSNKTDKLLPSRVIERDWASKKKSKIYLYDSLSHFAKSHFPEIKFPSDVIKSDAILKLENSSNFEMTHSAISTLTDLEDEITGDEAVRILRSAIDNNQVKWIIEDEDVKEFMKNIHSRHWADIPASLDEELAELSEYFAVPF